MADAIEDAYPSLLVEGNPEELGEPREGSFEVSLEDGSLLFSKLKESRFPEEEEVVDLVGSAVEPSS